MIQNQISHPLNKKFSSLTFSNSTQEKPRDKSSNKLERTPVADSFNDKKSKSYVTPLVAASALIASLVGVYWSHKGIKGVESSVQKLSDKISQQAPSTVASSVEKAAQEIQAPKVPEGLSIWGNTYLKLNDTGKLSEETVTKVQESISKAINGEYQMREVENSKLWSVSYEGWGAMEGGQHDVANELPIAMREAGVKNTFTISPLFQMNNTVKPEESFKLVSKEGEPNKFIYTPPRPFPGGSKQVELTKVYDEKMTGSEDKLQAFYGEIDGNKVIFVHDDRLFNLGDVADKKIYQSTIYSKEKTRIAQFNNMTYELLTKAKEGLIKLPDGKNLEAPNKMIAHEAWQSGGLLAKLRLLSIAEEAGGERSQETAAYLRELADNTSIPIHNIGNSYQGWPEAGSKEKPFEQIEEYWNTLYGKYAHSLVENSCIKDERLFGSELQRIGFVGDWMNPAHTAVALGTKLGTVSEGYSQEIVHEGLASKLTKLIQIKYLNDGIVAFPNGIDKKGLVASKENIDTIINTSDSLIHKTLKSLNPQEGTDISVRPYLQKWDASPQEIQAIDKNKLIGDRKHNKKLYLQLLKDAVQSYKEATPDVAGNKSSESGLFHGGTLTGFHGDDKFIDLSDVNPDDDIPIFSMASRLDSQKGFDTIADAIEKMMQKWPQDKPKPIFVISGEGDAALAKYLTDKKVKMGENGKRVLFIKDRLSDGGGRLTSMTSLAVVTPSDFEPYGISDLKGLYSGGPGIVTSVGGMMPEGSVSRKIYDFDDDPQTGNAIVVKGYTHMCTAKDNLEKQLRRHRNANELAKIMLRFTKLSPEEVAQMTKNALSTDVSWNKGAVQNYLDIMKMKVDKSTV